MMEIEKPKIVCEETDSGYFARFIVDPLEKGFGNTLGNALRRTLLSSLPGAAPIGIRIPGVLHEFSTIPGVFEDVVDIVLNIKGLAVKVNNQDRDYRTTLRIKTKKGGEITAKDFETNGEVEILNPDIHICSVEEGYPLELEVLIGKGRGYVPNVRNKELIENLDFIAIDSLYSPVKKVNYSVEPTRVGQSIDFDKLILEVETDGTISARDIVSLSGKILQDHISMFVDLCEAMSKMNILVSSEQDNKAKVLDMTIEEMELSVRSYNCLKRAGINNIQDLIQKTKDDMLKVRNLGMKSINEVSEKLREYGLNFMESEE
ncbi:MAG: DNA-directed RNA polymerase subunit alpha [Clostridia bacterium]|nr:DNA-directed RNA polymerase subunit alpha [Clostridia bacterium]